MAVNIKNPDVERLLNEVVAATGETKTEAIRLALAERRERLALLGLRTGGKNRFIQYLEDDVWPQVPPDQLGRRLSKDEEEALLGLGPEGA